MRPDWARPTATIALPARDWGASVEAWSVRWVLLHLIQETARHAGHADIIRESLDGATMYELMAASEGWLDDLKRWQAEYAGGTE